MKLNGYPMIVDVFIWSYEREAVDIRLANLIGVVDKHVAVQATNTFRGTARQAVAYGDPRVDDVIVTIPDGLNVWESEKWLRDQSLLEAIKLYGDNAAYMVCDGDEIPHPDAIKDAYVLGLPKRLITDYRNFYADWRAVDHELAHQPTIGYVNDYEIAGGACNARWNSWWPVSSKKGWHLSSLGNNDQIQEKLSTFAHTEYDTPEYRQNIENARSKMRDFLDRYDLEFTNDIPKGVPAHLLGGKHD